MARTWNAALREYEDYQAEDMAAFRAAKCLAWRLEGVRPTRFAELGYVTDGPSLWRVVVMESGNRVGPNYRTRTELLADLERYAKDYGCS